MSVKLVNEVLDHAPADWTQAERLFVAVLAEKARDETRRAWPGQATIARRTGLQADSVTRMCHRLAAKGWEMRERIGADRNGKPIFARKGHAAVYAIPRLCPLDEHDPDVCFPARARTTVGPTRGDDVAPAPPHSGASPDDGPGYADSGPGYASGAAAGVPDGGPGFSEKARTVVRESPDGGPALTVNEPSNFNPHTPAPTPPLTIPSPRPTDEVLNWSIANDQSQRRTGSINPPKVGRQSALFAAKDVKLTEREQIIFDWLRANGHPEATRDDAKAVDKHLRQQYPGKGPGYLRGIANNSGFTKPYQEIREARAQQVEQLVAQLQAAHPDCRHGTAAGDQPHPTTGILMCPWCRSGTDRPVDVSQPRTHPAVAAAMTVYRSSTHGRISAGELLRLAQQATVLHQKGATADQLAGYAQRAAATQISFLEAAAASKDHS